MKTWNDYKEHIKVIDSIAKADIEESERIAVIVSAMIEKHNEMNGMSTSYGCYIRKQLRNVHGTNSENHFHFHFLQKLMYLKVS